MDRNNAGVFIIRDGLLRKERLILGVRTPLGNGNPLKQVG